MQEDNKKRNVSLDTIRIISFIFVISIHTSPKPLEENALFSSIFLALLYTCNSNFYMMSGELNLRKKIENLKDYKNYYLNKVISILFPYVVITFFLTLLNITDDGNRDFSFITYVKTVYINFMSSNTAVHLWFLYPLMGLLLMSPFLAKLFAKMKNEELHIMFAIAIAWNFISVYMTKDIGIDFAYSGWLWNGWPIAFFAGYYSSRVISCTNRKKWYFAGFVSYLITVLGKWLIPDYYKYVYDLAPAYVIFTMTLYSFLKDAIKIRQNCVQVIISFLAKHSFMAYMIHARVIQWSSSRFMNADAEIPAIYFFPRVTVTFILSMIIAVIVDVCIMNPVQKLLRNILIKS